MKILIACEFSATVRDAFRERGHDAWSCDLLPTEGDPRWHIKGDVVEVLSAGWDMMIAHPSCTYLANSGVSWLHKHTDRWPKLFEAAEFFKKLLSAPIGRKAIENPIMHKYAVTLIGRKQDQVIQPSMFGHFERKATCLWLDGLPKLYPTQDVSKETMLMPANQRQRLHYLPPSEERWKERSRTYPGIASAFAEQWGAA